MLARACAAMLLLGLGVEAFRTSEVTTVQDAIDWSAIVENIREIDQTKDSDAFVVFESATDTELTQVSKPALNKVSLETFVEALRSCVPKNKICIGYYKVNYPMFVGSSTRKEKAVLVMGFEKVPIKVKMPVVKFVWPPLKQALRDAGIAPSATFELSNKRKLDAFGPDALWKEFASKATRVEDAEIQAFRLHEEEQTKTAEGGSFSVMDPEDTSKPTGNIDNNEGHIQPSSGGNSGNAGVRVDPKMIEDLVEKKMKDIEEKVEEIVEEKASTMAVKAAQDEVGRAIRKLGDKVEDAYTSVGKMWIDKAKK